MMPTNLEIVSAIFWLVVAGITTIKMVASARKSELNSVFGYGDDYYNEY